MSVAAASIGEGIVLNDTIHQATRLRIMTVLVSIPEADRLAYGFIQETLGLTGGNLTIHLRKLQQAGYVQITKEFRGSKPRTWIQSTPLLECQTSDSSDVPPMTQILSLKTTQPKTWRPGQPGFAVASVQLIPSEECQTSFFLPGQPPRSHIFPAKTTSPP